MRAEWLVVVGSLCLATALVEAWLLTAIRQLHVDAVKRMIPDSQQLLRSHIDYLMMTGLLFVTYLLFKHFAVRPSALVVIAMCFGSVMNPAAFLVTSIRPRWRQDGPPVFAALVALSFVATTIGYLGAAWYVARAALAAA